MSNQKELTTLLEQKETSNIEIGRKLYKDAYRKIVTAKLPGLFEVDPEIATDILVNILRTLELLVDSEDNFNRIPRLGTTGEVLTKIALDAKGIQAIPSELKEDVSESFDFTILGRRVDITTSPLDDAFVKKFTDGHPITLFVPSYELDLSNQYSEISNLPKECSYGYKLIYEQTFDVDRFLEDTLNINYAALDILEDICDNGSDNNYELNSNQFGDITPELVLEYQSFLDDLSQEIYTPLDNN